MNTFLRLCAIACLSLIIGAAALADPPADQPAVTIPPQTPITMHMTSVHPLDALNELMKQTGTTVNVWPENLWDQNRGPGNSPPTSIDVNVDQQPFWVVLGKICQASQLSPAYMGNPDVTLQWYGQGQSHMASHPTSASPTAMAMINEIHRNSTVSFDSSDESPQKSCGAGMDFYLDPRLRALSYDPQVHIETADDENGRSVAPTSPAQGQPNMQSINCRWMLQGLSIPLDYDPKISHKLKTLKGSVHIYVASEVDTLQIDNLANAQGITKTLGGMNVSIDDVKMDDHSFNMTVNLDRNDMGEDEWRQIQQNFFQIIHFQSASGKTLGIGGGGGGDNKHLKYTLSQSFSSDSDKPAKLIWEVPTKFDDVDLPFEFHDLALP